MRLFVDLETEAKPRFLNHEEPRTWLLTDLEDGLFANFIWKCKIDCYLYTGPVDFSCGFDISWQHHN